MMLTWCRKYGAMFLMHPKVCGTMSGLIEKNHSAYLRQNDASAFDHVSLRELISLVYTVVDKTVFELIVRVANYELSPIKFLVETCRRSSKCLLRHSQPGLVRRMITLICILMM